MVEKSAAQQNTKPRYTAYNNLETGNPIPQSRQEAPRPSQHLPGRAAAGRRPKDCGGSPQRGACSRRSLAGGLQGPTGPRKSFRLVKKQEPGVIGGKTLSGILTARSAG